MRPPRRQKAGYTKNATVWLLTVAFLFWRGGLWHAGAETPTPSDPTDTLLAGLTDCADVIDLRGASLPVSELGRVYADLLLDRPELFHVAPRLSYGYAEVGGVRAVTEVYPVYTLTGDDLTAARALYRDTVTGILADMEQDFGDYPRTEADTVLWLHDTLADDYDYDTRPDGESNADAYSFFRDGVGICQAYALAFLALCREAGLAAHAVVSGEMDHAWNHVRVDGVWYHVDVTRDDPIPAAGGSPTVTHTRLLRSDGGMEALGYTAYSCPADHTCSDTRYEAADGSASLGALGGALAFRGGKWLGMDENGGILAVKMQENGVFTGQVGDTDLNGVIDPADLLAVYDPALPEEWREWMRERLVGVIHSAQAHGRGGSCPSRTRRIP